MNPLPEPQPTTAEPTVKDRLEAARLLAALDEIPTAYRDTTPVPAYGPTPPVPQPGRPAMSERATDTSVLMLAAGGSVSMVTLSAGVLMYLSQYADPVVCGIVFGAPTAVVLALARLVGRAKAAMPADVHHHYNGTVVQDHSQVNTTTRGVWANTRNQLPK